ncbi:Kinesin protein [Fasciolopsis buskii]|uniref:Kinesin protein n=1 Tax=Fasciolopsis buskii TaxID=27845 RepID=A0A8E0RU52_9TREM|nr:Kinesin protein [Fasciolopsis buski]
MWKNLLLYAGKWSKILSRHGFWWSGYIIITEIKRQQWQVFPQAWNSEGFIVTDGAEESEPNPVQSASAQSWDEDRVEFVNIPSRGKLQTQIFETRTRVHCYFDPDEATWLRLPIAWELYSPAAKHLVNLVKDVCPGWGDDADILAALRVSNYNVDDCVNTYHSSIGRDETFTPPLVNSTNNGQSPIPHAIAMTTKHKSQDGGDDGHRELSVELEKLKHELSTTTLELSREQAAHEQLKVSENKFSRKFFSTYPMDYNLT